MREEIAALAEKAIQERVFPGCVIGVVRAGGEREIMPFGALRYEESDPVSERTVYDLASITKSIPTASLASLLIVDGAVRLDDPVKKYIPELENDFGATLEDLLRYRVKGKQLSTLRRLSAEEIQSRVFERGFDGPPGAGAYTNLPAYLLGIVIERAGGEKLAARAHRVLFEPLGMRSTTFFPSFAASDAASEGEPHHRINIAPTEIVDGEEVCGLPHDESAHVFARAGRAAGHAGLFSTTGDLLTFLEALLISKYGFTKPIVEGAMQGLGWQVNDARFMGAHARPRIFGKTGFTGTSVVCDAEHGIGLIILSNRTYPARPQDDDAINAFRRDVADLVLENIAD